MSITYDENNLPVLAQEAVFAASEEMPEGTPEVKGYDFNDGIPDLHALLSTYACSGFQAANVGRAIEEINKMLKWRLIDDPVAENESEEYKDPEVRKKYKCKVFLGYTSNLISCGVREVLRFLVEHKLVDVIVSTAGGIEEDFIKCLAPTYVGDFHSRTGAELRMKGLNRIGNMLVPNSNYCKFEDWIMPILDTMLEEQKTEGKVWAPSSIIHRLGLEIDDKSSVYYWAAKNNIPVYSPALTDGSIGDMIYFHGYKNPGLVVDIAQDIRGINNQAVFAKKTGMIILGGGVVKHHICNANLMRNGADFSVNINTGQEYDGSDSGARPDEAISWGKIRLTANPVKVYAEASLVFPLIVSETFARQHYEDVAAAKKEAAAKEADPKE
eukprot:TRINITY_DN3279_c0_g1_i2.p2 TRINITY_DN3279_c0_g1~~TRINITY_DN3279_c0_g1_i2.p2  ORF type:complete len:384 (+),score=106.27 TRINITY_DN3279_c0_g1_i2:2100-3251(+)